MPLLREFQQSGAISEYDDSRRKPHPHILPRRCSMRNDRRVIASENPLEPPRSYCEVERFNLVLAEFMGNGLGERFRT